MTHKRVKNPDSAQHKGYDAGKKLPGIKRHLSVDTLDIPHAVAVTTADVTDHKGIEQALSRCAAHLKNVQGVLTDAGYTGAPFAQVIKG